MNFTDCKLDDLKRFVGVRFIGFGASNDVIPKIWIKKWGRKQKKMFGRKIVHLRRLSPVQRYKNPGKLIPLNHCAILVSINFNY